MRSDTCSPVEVRALTAGGRRPFAYLPQAPPRGEAPPHAHCTHPTKMRFSINCTFRDTEGRDVVVMVVTYGAAGGGAGGRPLSRE